MSVGSIASVQRRVSETLVEPVAQAQAFVRGQKSQHVDETGWREGAQRKWLWVNATREVTVFAVLDGRSTKAAKQVINSSANSIITTDRYGVYNWLSTTRRQICWAHLRRDFQAMVERSGESAKTGKKLSEQVTRLFALWHHVRDRTLTRAELQAQTMCCGGENLSARRAKRVAASSSES